MNAEQIICRLEADRGQELTDDDRLAIQQWEDGRQLATLVGSPGWDVLKQKMADKAAYAIRELINLDPAEISKDAILASHAVAYATSKYGVSLIDEVERAVEESVRTPEVLKADLRRISPRPPELM